MTAAQRPEAPRPGWANAYESGYRVGYRHGMADAKAANDGPQPTPDAPPVDVSGTGDGQSAAVPPRSPRR